MSDVVKTVFCSKCGAGGQAADSYCRSCGAWLPDPDAAGRSRGLLRRGLSPERKLRKVHVLQAISGLSALAAAFILFAVGAWGLHPDLLGAAGVLCVEVAVLQVIAFFLVRSARPGQKSRQGVDQQRELPGVGQEAARALRPADTGGLARPPSVTEGTTALLDPVPRGGRREAGPERAIDRRPTEG